MQAMKYTSIIILLINYWIGSAMTGCSDRMDSDVKIGKIALAISCTKTGAPAKNLRHAGSPFHSTVLNIYKGRINAPANMVFIPGGEFSMGAEDMVMALQTTYGDAT